ncbi:MAG TPA: XdhC family protein [Jatrophihabitans sp.]|nr:XdhC family protein [Jatrophihabitans sp.]
MYEIAEDVQRWVTKGQDPAVAVVVAVRGLSAAEPASAWAWLPDGERAGRPVAALAEAGLPGRGLVDVTVSDAEAARSGLACGGAATLLVQPASAYPADLWARLADREPVCVVATTTASEVTGTEVFSTANIRDSHPRGDEVSRLFGRGVPATAIVAGDPTRVAVALWPVPTLVVVGDGLVAQALNDAATFLGWHPQVTPEVDAAVAAIARLRRSDAVVVLSHDRAVDGPALAAALRGGPGYVGAMGARHTQDARREWLTGHGVPTEEQARIHGPAGLDVDAHTPAEIAVSIVAEILAARAGSAGGALRDRSGPVHVGSNAATTPPELSAPR